MNGEYSLDKLSANEHTVARDIISNMLEHDANNRPLAKAVLAHPFFWSKERQLMFFQVSILFKKWQRAKSATIPIYITEREAMQSREIMHLVASVCLC